MIYGYYLDFDVMMQFIKELEARINATQHCNRVRNAADDRFSAAILANHYNSADMAFMRL